MAVTMLMDMNFTEYNREVACALAAFGGSVDVGVPESDAKWRSVLSLASKVSQLAAGIIMCQEALWVKDIGFYLGTIGATLTSASLVLSLKGLDSLTAGKGFNRYVKVIESHMGNLGQVAFLASTIALLVIEATVSKLALLSLGVNGLYWAGKVGRQYLGKEEEPSPSIPPQIQVPVEIENETPDISEYDSSGEEEVESILHLNGTSLDAKEAQISLRDFLDFLQEHPEIECVELPKCFLQELQERDVRKILLKLPNVTKIDVEGDGEKRVLVERYLRGYMQVVAIQSKLHETTELDISQSDISLDQFNDLINRRNRERIKHLEHIRSFPERIASKYTERDLRKVLSRLPRLKTIDIKGCELITLQMVKGVQTAYPRVEFLGISNEETEELAVGSSRSLEE